MKYEPKGWRDNKLKWSIRWVEDKLPIVLTVLLAIAVVLAFLIAVPWAIRTPSEENPIQHPWPVALIPEWVALLGLVLFGIHWWANRVNGDNGKQEDGNGRIPQDSQGETTGAGEPKTQEEVSRARGEVQKP